MANLPPGTRPKISTSSENAKLPMPESRRKTLLGYVDTKSRLLGDKPILSVALNAGGPTCYGYNFSTRTNTSTKYHTLRDGFLVGSDL